MASLSLPATQLAHSSNIAYLESLQLSNALSSSELHTAILRLLTVAYTDNKYIRELLELQTRLQGDASIPYEDVAGKSYIAYDSSRVQALTSAMAKNAQTFSARRVVITMTTCKRYDLFTQTINSFLACCLDLSLYCSHWFIVDDNSSETDRVLMTTNYPFVTLIRKTLEQKGHARSMNMLLDILPDADYVFNLEDDWRFFVPGPWLTKLMTVLDHNPRYGQALLNRAYGEDLMTSAKIWGSHRRYAPGLEPLRYYIHEYATGDALARIHQDFGKQGWAQGVYWPHYSLRPGLTRRSVYNTLGHYNETAPHFEREYAERYRSRFLTTYLDNCICSHIGRRTYERQGSKLNAYDLNREQQFGQAPKEQSSVLCSPQAESKKIDGGEQGPSSEIKLDAISSRTNTLSTTNPQNAPQTNIKAYVLNLKRRSDRLETFRNRNSIEFPSGYHIFPAVDGLKLAPNHAIQRLFEHNDYHYRRGIVGCAISHLLMWIELASSTQLHGMLIIEDDAELTNGFLAKFTHLLHQAGPEADIIFLHHHAYPAYHKKNDLDRNSLPVAERWSKSESQMRSMGGTTAYYISRQGATRMLEYITKNSIRYGIDWVMFNNDQNAVHYCSPFLAFADCAQTCATPGLADTDIQHVYDGCGFKDDHEWLQDELIHWGQVGVKAKFPEMRCAEDEKSSITCYERFGPDGCGGRELLDHLCLFRKAPGLTDWLRAFPVHWTSIGSWILSIPDNRIHEQEIQTRVWDGHLNVLALTQAAKDAQA